MYETGMPCSPSHPDVLASPIPWRGKPGSGIENKGKIIMIKSPRHAVAWTALAVALASAPTAVFAQAEDATSSDNAGGQGNDIIVTGTRISGPGLVSSSPVSTTDQEQIKLQSALTIEDTVLPRQFGTGETALISIEEGVGKMKAALSGRQDPSLVVAGRSSALSVTGVEDAIRRTKAYEAAGVDAMFLSGATTKAEVEAVRAEVKIPLMLGGAGGELSDRAFLSANGVRIALQGHLSFSASVKAIYDTLKALRDGVAPGDLREAI